MATVTGFTAERMQEIEDETVVDGDVNGSGHLILSRRDGVPIDAGYVVGPPGPDTASLLSPFMNTLADLASRTWELEAKSLAQDNGFKDWLGDPFVPNVNRIASRSVDAINYPALGIFRDPDIDTGFMSLEDIEPVEYVKAAGSGLPSNSLGWALSPNGNWLAVIGVGTITVYPMVNGVPLTTGTNGRTPAVAPATGNPSGGFGSTCVQWSRDGKTIFRCGATTPFLEAWTWDEAAAGPAGSSVALGHFGAKWANPGTLPLGVVNCIAAHPTANYIAYGINAGGGPWARVIAYTPPVGSAAGAWGATSANPGTDISAAVSRLRWRPQGDVLFAGWTAAPYVSAYPFNAGTGVLSNILSPAAPVNVVKDLAVADDGSWVVALHNQTPGVTGWNWTAGAWGAKWADPAVASPGSYAAGNLVGGSFGKSWIVFQDGTGGGHIGGAYNINAGGSWGTKFSPPSVGSLNLQGIARNLIDSPASIFAVDSSGSIWLIGDRSGSPALSGTATTITKTLAANATQLYVADDWTVTGAAPVPTRQYEVSLDGGTTWQIVPVGVLTQATTPGNQLKIRITITRSATGKTGRMNWFNVWAA